MADTLAECINRATAMVEAGGQDLEFVALHFLLAQLGTAYGFKESDALIRESEKRWQEAAAAYARA